MINNLSIGAKFVRKHDNKKLFLKLLTSSLILPLSVNAINCVLNNNSNNLAINDLDKYSHATVENYGTWTYEKRNFKLNLYLTSSTYNYFLAMFDEDITRNIFLGRFLGKNLSWLVPKWQTVIKQIHDGLKLKSTQSGYTILYFWHLFYDWINSTKGFNIFKQVYTGKYLKNNIYPMMPDYNSQKAQLSFRRNGILLQFDFTYIVNPEEKSWYINSSSCRAFPYSSKYDSLAKYYLMYSWIDHYQRGTPPLIPVYINKDPREQKLDVKFLCSQIKTSLLYVFNLDEASSIAKLIGISSDDFYKELYYGKNNPETIHLNFYSKIIPTLTLLCSKEIKLYLVKEY